MPLIDPSTVPATDERTDLAPLADLVPCDVREDFHPDGDCPTPFQCPTPERGAVITHDQLLVHLACGEQLDRFTELFGEEAEVEVTEDLAATHADVFDWSWAWDELIDETADADAYEKALDEWDNASAECNQVGNRCAGELDSATRAERVAAYEDALHARNAIWARLFARVYQTQKGVTVV